MSCNQVSLEASSIPSEIKEKARTYLLFKFPDDKKKIAKLSMDEKLEWYAYQFDSAGNPSDAIVLLSAPEFVSFWKWQVMVPRRIKRFYYRVKNGEIFKRYAPYKKH